MLYQAVEIYEPGAWMLNDSLLKALMENISSGLVFVDANGVLSFMNSVAETILQTERDTVLGKRVDMLSLLTPLYKVLSEPCRDFPLDVNIQGRSISISSREIRSPEGVPLGEMTELRDITDEKRERREREEFVAMMTHDLKSPLTVILGYIQAMRDGMFGEMPQAVGSCIGEMERSGFKLLSMIEDVLDAYRLEVGLLELNREPCDVRGIIESCHYDYLREAEAQGVRLTLDLEKGIPLLKADMKQLSRVFSNLIANAIKFTPKNGEVAIGARLMGDELQVSVRDTGIGIAEKDLPRIFNKYFRTAGAKGFRGSGLGLTISMAIVNAHGGAIEVESAEGKGSTFTVKLPLQAKNEQHISI